jgi:hypothetical protein
MNVLSIIRRTDEYFARARKFLWRNLPGDEKTGAFSRFYNMLAARIDLEAVGPVCYFSRTDSQTSHSVVMHRLLARLLGDFDP